MFEFFFTFSTKSEIRSTPRKSVENSPQKIIGSIDLYRRGHDFLGHAVYSRFQKYKHAH
jgi:hypothetical protein